MITNEVAKFFYWQCVGEYPIGVDDKGNEIYREFHPTIANFIHNHNVNSESDFAAFLEDMAKALREVKL